MQPLSTPAALLPSGRQVTIGHGEQRLIVVEVGGGIRRFTVGGEDVIDGYGADEMCQSGRGQLLLPWPNRLAEGTYEFDGVTLHTPLSEAEHGNAIHGLTRFANWRLAEQSIDRAALTYRLHPQAGYPFLLDLRVEYHLDDAGLRVTMTATNRGDRRCPYGAGAHPYLRLGTDSGRVDDWTLKVPAATRLETDDRGIPVRRRPLDATTFDFRQPRPIGAAVLDTGFTDLQPGADGRAAVEVGDTRTGRQVQLWVDEGFSFLMVFTGDTVPEARRRRGLAVEPMTCAPNAFRSGEGLQVLEPGQSTTATWGISTTGFPG